MQGRISVFGQVEATDLEVRSTLWRARSRGTDFQVRFPNPIQNWNARTVAAVSDCRINDEQQAAVGDRRYRPAAQDPCFQRIIMLLARRALLWIPKVLLKFFKILSKTWRGMSKVSQTLPKFSQTLPKGRQILSFPRHTLSMACQTLSFPRHVMSMPRRTLSKARQTLRMISQGMRLPRQTLRMVWRVWSKRHVT